MGGCFQTFDRYRVFDLFCCELFVNRSVRFCLSFHSELLFLHLWHAAAPVSGHVPYDWLHHGLEDEGL